jgi:pyruvate/2-oxoglutarate dehydrogenase complex dihydrolipoamide acyltransferase (E2) component
MATTILRRQHAGVVIAVLAFGLASGCGKKEAPAEKAPEKTPAAEKAPEKAPEKTPANAPPPKTPAQPGLDPNFERFSDQAADNQIDVPKDWGHAPVGDSLLITSPDKQVFIELSASLAMGKDKADEKKLIAKLEKSLQKVKRTSPITKATQNGLAGWKFGGTAMKNGKAYDWESFALEDAAGKGAFGLVYASTADLVSHRAIIDKILGSISAITH